MKHLPPIVIMAYNRPKALKRLLGSLAKAEIPENVKLIFSLEGNAPAEVVDIATGFSWKHGDKQIIQHQEHLGLLNHIKFILRLARENESIIRIEDDLFVSPLFYSYAQKALEFHGSSKNIAFISLYKYYHHPYCPHPFIPVQDIHFIQKMSTWGEVWRKEEAVEILDFIDNFLENEIHVHLPSSIKNWGLNEWEFYFNAYLVKKNKFVAFPGISYSTNFADIGLHVNQIIEENIFQSPLQIFPGKLNFTSFDDALAKYDAFFELLPESIKKLNPKLNDYDFDVDLYALKEPHQLTRPHVLGSKIPRNYIMSFGRNLKPHELNIAFDIEGKDIFLAKREHYIESKKDSLKRKYRQYFYFYPDMGLAQLIKFKLMEVKNRYWKK